MTSTCIIFGMKNRHGPLERELRESIRETLTQLPLQDSPVDSIAKQLTNEIINSARLDREGRAFAPDQYTLSVHPGNIVHRSRIATKFQERLVLDIHAALQRTDFHFAREPHCTLATDPTLGEGQVRVIAWHSSDPLRVEEEIEPQPENDTDRPPAGAFLIIEGKQHYQLKTPLVTIGRRLDNHLVLDDSHVSRQHARLRANRGSFLLTDLDSTSGTKVNGREITEHTLRPGDVITIAAIELIYGEDPEGPPKVTPPYFPSPETATDQDQDTPLYLKMGKEDKTATLGEEDT